MRPRPGSIDEWMEASSKGDDDAFGMLAEAAQDDLYRFACAQGLVGADAAEAVQEALVRAWRIRRSWRPGGAAATWLTGITLNVVREMRRTQRRQEIGGFDASRLVGDSGPDDADREDRLARLVEALETLPPRQREAVACRYLRRMSVRQAAEVMNCAEGTVKAAVSKALITLRKVMGAVEL